MRSSLCEAVLDHLIVCLLYTSILTVARMIDGLTISKKELESGQIRVPKYRALYLDSVYREFGGIQFDRDQNYKSVIRTMKSIEDSDFEIPGEFRAILRGYQKTGFRWLKTLDAVSYTHLRCSSDRKH